MSMSTVTTWDTNELDTWLHNDESLYNVCLALYDRNDGNVSGSEAEEELLPLVISNEHIDVDYSEVDWDEIADSINEIHS